MQGSRGARRQEVGGSRGARSWLGMPAPASHHGSQAVGHLSWLPTCLRCPLHIAAARRHPAPSVWGPAQLGGHALHARFTRTPVPVPAWHPWPPPHSITGPLHMPLPHQALAECPLLRCGCLRRHGHRCVHTRGAQTAVPCYRETAVPCYRETAVPCCIYAPRGMLAPQDAMLGAPRTMRGPGMASSGGHAMRVP